VSVSRTNPYVLALRESVKRSVPGEALSVGREGASDAAAFLAAGIPAVEFGPAGEGHHGPEEWVAVSSLARYRRALGEFVRALPMHLEQAPSSADAIQASGNQAGEEPAAQAWLRALPGGKN
jgi:succinyl-diaminopimelate desuccinylase